MVLRVNIHYASFASTLPPLFASARYRKHHSTVGRQSIGKLEAALELASSHVTPIPPPPDALTYQTTPEPTRHFRRGVGGETKRRALLYSLSVCLVPETKTARAQRSSRRGSAKLANPARIPLQLSCSTSVTLEIFQSSHTGMRYTCIVADEKTPDRMPSTAGHDKFAPAYCCGHRVEAPSLTRTSRYFR